MRIHAKSLVMVLCLLCLEPAHCRPRLFLPRYAAAARDILGLIGEDGNQVPGLSNPPDVKKSPTPLNTLGQTVQTTSTKLTMQSTPTSTTSVTSNTIGALAVSRLPEVPQSTLVLSPSQSDPSNITDSPTPSESPWVGEASTTPPAELTQWKIIGIGVITVTFIAIIILSVSFFDSWWGFVRAVTFGERGRKGKSEGQETMVPDQTVWELKLANENGHRYPTMASSESIVKEKELLNGWGLGEKHHAEKITVPELAYGGV